jgi:hypothetical protein
LVWGNLALASISSRRGMAEQLVHTLFGNFLVQQLAHAQLRIRQVRLQFLLRMRSRVFQDGLYKFTFKIVAFSGENLSSSSKSPRVTCVGLLRAA